MKQYVIEKIEEINIQIKKYESMNYSIYDVSRLVNDRKEYDSLKGELKTLEMMLHLIKREESDKEIRRSLKIRRVLKLSSTYTLIKKEF